MNLLYNFTVFMSKTVNFLNLSCSKHNFDIYMGYHNKTYPDSTSQKTLKFSNSKSSDTSNVKM